MGALCLYIAPPNNEPAAVDKKFDRYVAVNSVQLRHGFQAGRILPRTPGWPLRTNRNRKTLLRCSLDQEKVPANLAALHAIESKFPDRLGFRFHLRDIITTSGAYWRLQINPDLRRDRPIRKFAILYKDYLKFAVPYYQARPWPRLRQLIKRVICGRYAGLRATQSPHHLNQNDFLLADETWWLHATFPGSIDFSEAGTGNLFIRRCKRPSGIVSG